MSKMFIPVLKEASRWGPGGPYIIKPYQLAKEIAKHLDTDNATKDEVDFFADRLLDKIESALMYYQLIVADEFEGRDISQKRTIYEGLYANLWSFYKSRAQNYLNKMGWDIGFFFCKENPEHKSIVNYAKKQRDGWQAEFALSWNVAEHSGDYRDGAKCYENPDEAKHFLHRFVGVLKR